MFPEIIKRVVNAAYEVAKEQAIAEGRYFEEENIILHKDTIDLLKEIEVFHKQNAIDKALCENDKSTFLQLTGDFNA